MQEIDFNKLSTHSIPAPRYTSYPTAVEFSQSFNASSYTKMLESSNTSNLPLSLYTHLPFCRSACYFCGCNVIYTSKEDNKLRYISYLKKELDLLSKVLDMSREVVQFHFGGGTPTFFNADELKSVLELIKSYFKNFNKDAEISCEIDPRYFDTKQMEVLKKYGFNRLSFGVQDFESSVQQAIHRIQPEQIVKEAINLARKNGIDSINFDLIYGLPNQTLDTFKATLEKVVNLAPDRLAIFNYAHMPWIKKTMRKIDETLLPSPAMKLEILKHTISFLESKGYGKIGMDHFAKKSDSLYLATQKGELRRNFQGYTTKGFSQTIGIGLTSISEGLNYYSQNFKDIKSYEESLDSGILPVDRGIELSSEDILRKAVIMELMNNSQVIFKDIQSSFDIDFKTHFKEELDSLLSDVESGLITIDNNGIYATPTGIMLIRNIAMKFDNYLQKHAGQKRFSKSI